MIAYFLPGGGGGVGAVLMSFDNFLLFWGIGGLGVVSGMVFGHDGWGGQRGLWGGSMHLQLGKG